MPTNHPASDRLATVRIPRPVLVGIASGVVVSAAIPLLDVLPDSQGHAILVAAIATPYLVFALLDGTARSLVVETAVTLASVAMAFLVFDSPTWIVAVALAAHGLWNLAHLNGRITGDYPIWCGSLDVTAAAMLLAATVQ